MKNKVFLVLVLILAISIYLGISYATFTPDDYTCKYNSTNPTYPNWNISDSINCVVADEIIELVGNLTVYGNLTFDNVTLIVNTTADHQRNITVFSGGRFNITNSSNITSNSTKAYVLAARAGSIFEMRDSYTSRVGNGTGTDTYGLSLLNEDAYLENNTIQYGHFSLYLEDSNNTVIRNNTFLNNRAESIYVRTSNNVTIANNNFTNLTDDDTTRTVHLDGGFDNITIANNSFEGAGHIDYAILSEYANYSQIINNTIQNYPGLSGKGAIHLVNSSFGNISNNTIINGSQIGIAVYTSSNNNTFDRNNLYNNSGNSYDIDLSYYNNVTNNIFDNSSNLYLSGADWNRFENNIIRCKGKAYGLAMSISDNNVLYNNILSDCSRNAYYIYGSSSDNEIWYGNITNSTEWDLRFSSANVTIYNLTLFNFNISGHFLNINISNISSPPPDATEKNLTNASIWVNITNTSAGGYAFTNISYDEKIGFWPNANVSFYENTSDTWSLLSGAGNNVSAGYVYANITTFTAGGRIFAPMINITAISPPPPPLGDGGGGGGYIPPIEPPPEEITDIPEEEIPIPPPGTEIIIPPGGIAIRLEDGVFLSLYPVKTRSATIHNISKVNASQYKILLCNQTVLSSWEINVTADASYFCMDYSKYAIEDPTVNIFKFDGKDWTPLKTDDIIINREKKIICGNITRTPYMISGFTPDPNSTLALESIERVNRSIIELEDEKDVSGSRVLLEEALLSYYNCDYIKAKFLADQALSALVGLECYIWVFPCWVILVIIVGGFGVWYYYLKGKVKIEKYLLEGRPKKKEKEPEKEEQPKEEVREEPKEESKPEPEEPKEEIKPEEEVKEEPEEKVEEVKEEPEEKSE
ncbi:MAG: right-handed parallel beta-helix repeat-containing protein [Candidatus Hodarchaeales archaeon]|jgi:parallel beta-helix repeat protein